MTYKNIDFDWLEKIIVPAIDSLYSTQNDKDLLERNAGERTIVAKIYCNANAIFQEEKRINSDIEDLDIDIEYNRNFFESKEVFEKCDNCTNSDCPNIKKRFMITTSSPDFIIHNRGTNNNNQVIIEFKKVKNTNKGERLGDMKKLTYFTCQKPFPRQEKKNYKYRIGYFIDLDENKFSITTYQDALCNSKRCRQNGEWK